MERDDNVGGIAARTAQHNMAYNAASVDGTRLRMRTCGDWETCKVTWVPAVGRRIGEAEMDTGLVTYWPLNLQVNATMKSNATPPHPNSVFFKRPRAGFTTYNPKSRSRASTSGGLAQICPSYQPVSS